MIKYAEAAMAIMDRWAAFLFGSVETKMSVQTFISGVNVDRSVVS